MKAKHLTLLVAILSFAIIALGACSKSATNTNTTTNSNTSTASTTPANKPSPPATSTADYSTPTASFKSFYDAAKANNVEGMKNSMSKNALAEVTQNATSQKKTLDGLIQEMVNDAPSSMPEMRNEKIDGDYATIEMKDDKMKDWTKIHFVKEDGKWKMSATDERSGKMDSMDHSGTEKK